MLSVAVMAHPKRQQMVDHLLYRLGLPPERVVWERGEGEWDTGCRSWEAHDPAASHHFVIQDDALVSKDLLVALERALPHVEPEAVVCPFLGTPHPGAKGVERIQARVEEARQKHASWVVMPSLHWGLGIILPVRTIPGMLSWCEGRDEPYDKRIGLYFRDILGWRTRYTWPSLIEHCPGESLTGHGWTQAYDFIGEHRSALRVNWKGQVVGRRTPLK